jgi:predicted MFS family arabinose efflux permease
MPMGPDFAGALGIPLSKLGVIGGAYTAAATVVGASAAAFLDRFERRSALVWSVTGLGLSTLACAVDGQHDEGLGVHHSSRRIWS